jgi:hypothetical protein
MKKPSSIISNLIVPFIVSLLFALQVLSLLSLRSRSLCLAVLPWHSGPGGGVRVSIVPPAQQPKPVVPLRANTSELRPPPSLVRGESNLEK